MPPPVHDPKLLRPAAGRLGAGPGPGERGGPGEAGGAHHKGQAAALILPNSAFPQGVHLEVPQAERLVKPPLPTYPAPRKKTIVVPKIFS